MPERRYVRLRSERRSVLTDPAPCRRTCTRRRSLSPACTASTSPVRGRGYDDLEVVPDPVVSVCGRAHESVGDLDILQLHWSVPDPVDDRAKEFLRTSELLSKRIGRLTRAVPAA